LWHVHIPKTAGTSFFSAADESGWDYLSTNSLSASAGDLQKVARSLRTSPHSLSRTIVSGHWQLFRHLDSVAPSDRVVVFVRDPVECMASEFNYAIDVVNGASNVHAGEAQPFLDRGLDPTSFRRTYERSFFAFNLQCSFLSLNGACASAIKNLTASNADLLPCEAMDQTIAQYFPSVPQRRVNASNRHISATEIPRAIREEILVRSAQDVLLHQIARMRLDG
jgi:hypothetical protein